MIDVIARNWGWVAFRGVLAVLFGLLTIFDPAITLLTLVLVYGAYAFVDGVAAIISVIANRRGQPHWVSMLVGGIAGIVVGVITFFMPAITATVLVLLIAAWAIVTGVTRIVAAVRLRKEIKGEWFLMLTGALAVLFGAILIARPGAGALALAFWIGIYVLVLGVGWIAFEIRLRRWVHRDPGAAAFRPA